MRAELCECKFYESQFLNVNFMRAGLCKCEFHGSWTEHWEVNFMKAELCKGEFYESWAFWIWILWDLSWALWLWILCEPSWAWWMLILQVLSIVNVNLLRAKHCKCKLMRAELCEWNIFENQVFKCEYLESWALKTNIRAEYYECEYYEGWCLRV